MTATTPPPAGAPDLHAEIMNLRCEVPPALSKAEAYQYKIGHRDARHAAAELVAADTVAPQSVSVPEGWRDLIERTIERLSKAQIFPLVTELRQALAAAPIPQPQADARQELTINGRQLRDALEAAWPDRDDAEQGDTELTLFVRKQDDMSDEGEAMPRGLWFYWSEYPEEGVCQLDADAGEPAGPIFKRAVERSMPSDGGASALDGLPQQGEGSIDSDLPPLPDGKMCDTPAGLEMRFSAKQMREYAISARLARTAAPSEPMTDEQLGEHMRQVLGHRAVANIASGRNISLTMDQARKLVGSAPAPSDIPNGFFDSLRPAPAPSESQAIPTDLSKRLRDEYNYLLENRIGCATLHRDDVLAAADEIDRLGGINRELVNFYKCDIARADAKIIELNSALAKKGQP